MLMLVQSPTGGNGADPPTRRRGRSPALSLTPSESRALRTTIRNLGRAFGSMVCMADAIGIPVGTLYKLKRHGAALALAVARAAGMSVEAVIGGKLTAAGRCPTCGHRAGDGRLVAGGGS